MNLDPLGAGRAYMKFVLYGAVFVITLVLQVFILTLVDPGLVDGASVVPLLLISALATWASRGWINRTVPSR